MRKSGRKILLSFISLVESSLQLTSSGPSIKVQVRRFIQRTLAALSFVYNVRIEEPLPNAI